MSRDRLVQVSLAGLVLVLGSASCSEAESDFDAPFAAVVTRSKARFVFPVPERESWPINLPATRTGAQEYQWEIEVVNESQKYLFGYSRYKSSGPQQDLDFPELLTRAQTSVWKIENGGSTIPSAAIYLERIAPGRIAIWLSDAETVQQLFGARPDSVTFRWHTPLDSAGSRRVAVRYHDG
jgi:hypothetical protein